MNKLKKIKLLVMSCILVTILLASTSVFAKNNYNVKRIYGADRYKTSVEISNEFNNGTVQNVIVANGESFPDALAGSVLSKKLNAPILLASNDVNSSSDSISYIQKHLSTTGTIYVLGGEASVSNNYIAYLNTLGYKNIKRLGGINRFDTNKLIMQAMNIQHGTPIVLVNGYGFADALSVSSIAASKGYPILMSDSSSLPDETIQEIKQVQPNSVYIIGGQASLSDNIINQIKSLLPSIQDNNINRIGGTSRYDTSLLICKYFNMNTNTAVIANGEKFPDALSGSALAAKLNAPIILANSIDIPDQKNFLDSTTNYTNLILLGGQSAISEATEAILNGTLTSDQAVDMIKSRVTLQNNDTLEFYEEGLADEMPGLATTPDDIAEDDCYNILQLRHDSYNGNYGESQPALYLVDKSSGKIYKGDQGTWSALN